MALGRVAAAPASAPAAAASGRGRARRRAAWRRRLVILAFLSPWIVGFSIFFGYPLVMSAYLSFTSYDLLSPPRWVGLDNYRYLLGEDVDIWPAVRNTLWIIAVGVPLQVLFAFGIAVMLTRARAGVGCLPDRLLPPCPVPPVAATLGFVYVLNPSTGPVNTILEQLGIDGPLWFNDPSWSKPSLVMLERLGDRQHDDHLPRGCSRRPAPPLRIVLSWTARARCNGCAG